MVQVDPLPARARNGTTRVLVIQGHPRTDSLCAALGSAYADGARRAGADVSWLTLADLAFDLNVRQPSPGQQPLEPDLAHARDLIAQSDHLVFVYPTWWGTMPALLKGFLDRVLVPGWAFEFHDDGRTWDKLLTSHTAELITTMDTPPWAHRVFNRRPGHNAMRRATLGFCGVRTVHEMVCGPVITSSRALRGAWLKRAYALGLSLGSGPVKPHQRLGDYLTAWLKALRLQFYPMTWMAYTVGALAAPDFIALRYWLGYALLFLLEAATVFINEVQDYDTDQRNQAFGPFTGGSRVLVTGDLTSGQLNKSAAGTAGLAVIAAIVLLPRMGEPLQAAVVLATMAVLALGYTLPPFRLCYRGLGELDVAVTHSIAVLLCGFVLQGGDWLAPQAWLLGMPLFWSVLGAITLAGIPDRAADGSVGKRTLAVRLGSRRALTIAAVTTVLAPLSMLFLPWHGMPAYTAVLGGIVVHALLILVLLGHHALKATPLARINGLLVAALTFILWFCLPPLVWLAR